jgi:hypothetical protein
VAAQRYQLIVEGELGDELDPVFEGFTLTRAAGTTSLTGIVRDQAELQGLLQQVSNRGLTLLEVTVVDEAGQPVGIQEQVFQAHRARKRGLRWHREEQRVSREIQ